MHRARWLTGGLYYLAGNNVFVSPVGSISSIMVGRSEGLAARTFGGSESLRIDLPRCACTHRRGAENELLASCVEAINGVPLLLRAHIAR